MIEITVRFLGCQAGRKARGHPRSRLHPDPEFAAYGWSETFVNRFWAKVDKNGPIPEHRPELGNCWIWTGTLDTHGYGVIGRGSGGAGLERAPRAAWMMLVGKIPNKFGALHKCDNPRCVRVSHIWTGNQFHNMSDCSFKNRMNTPNRVGENNGRSRLTCEQVDNIRTLYPSLTKSQLSRLFRVTKTNINYIILRKTWNHV